MLRLIDVSVGDTVIVKPDFGFGDPIEVVVTETYGDVKRGRPGIEYGDHWAYLDQVIRVVKRSD